MLTYISNAEQIKKLRHNGLIDHEFSVFWVPRRTLVSDQVLEEAGVLGEVNVAEWPLNFVPLSDDLLSLELEDSITDLYVVSKPMPECLIFWSNFDDSARTQRPHFSRPVLLCRCSNNMAYSHA